ncbi:hypothetical protein [Legionella saoudiensis]|uniref:hypothetical protein n=1 Tax=Legionella saoudiensis TaxID=1750561 RepID=UPI00072FE422|nr:hypothetical protein [Legionella saoudiensis]
MKNIHFDQKIFSNMEFPLQKLMELNIKTMQGFSYMKPGELFNIKKPEELLEKNMNMFIRNSHMALDYMRNTFNILENHWIKVSHRTEDTAREVAKQATSTARQVTSTVKQAAPTAKQASSTAKKTEKKATKPAAAKKTAAHTKSAAKASTKTVAKAGEKTSAKKAAKPAVQHSKPSMSHTNTAAHTAHTAKQEPHAADEKAKHHQVEHKEHGHAASKVSPMHDKGHGLLNKGRNFPS